APGVCSCRSFTGLPFSSTVNWLRLSRFLVGRARLNAFTGNCDTVASVSDSAPLSVVGFAFVFGFVAVGAGPAQPLSVRAASAAAAAATARLTDGLVRRRRVAAPQGT